MTDFRGLWLKRRDSAKSTSFSGCEQKFLIFFHYFFAKIREMHYSRTLTACNSSCIQAGTVANGTENVSASSEVRTEKSNIFHRFSQKIRAIPYSRNVKTSIGNNSGSVEDRAVKFAYSRGFSATEDRMV